MEFEALDPSSFAGQVIIRGLDDGACRRQCGIKYTRMIRLYISWNLTKLFIIRYLLQINASLTTKQSERMLRHTRAAFGV